MRHIIYYISVVSFLLIGGKAAHAQQMAYQNIIQHIEEDRPQTAIVRIYQDPRIATLIGTARDTLAMREPMQVWGYRVQVYAGGNSNVARQEAGQIGEKVKEKFPQLTVYSFFETPRWLCHIGDFRSREEADVVMRKLRGTFKEATTVRSKINIYY